LGFACAENLLYVFVYTPPGLNQEISTLIVRCLFPIHPLAAAIQSLGVCRRELENDSSTQVGRILFPAWLLHGAFDFFLMAYSLIAKILSEPDSDGGTTPSTTRTGNLPEQESISSTVVVSCVMIIPLMAVYFYFKNAWDQRDRLEELDKLITIVV
jgi:PrsW family intramembrane metalloprotease